MSRRAMAWTMAVILLIGGTAVGIRAQEGEGDEERAEREDRQRTVRIAAPMVRARALASGGWLGVRVEDVDASRAGELGLDGPRGALVEGVEEGSPAADAGLEEGDVIVSFDGEAVRSVAELVRLVRETPAGRSVSLEVMRDGASRRLTVEVGERPGSGFRFRVGPGDVEDLEVRLEGLRDHLSEERMARVHERVERAMERAREHAGDLRFEWNEDGDGVHVFRFMARPRLGVQLQTLTDQLAEHFGVGERGGVLVSSVREGSAAADAGLRAGDVVVAFDDEEVESARDLMRAVREAEAGSVRVTVVRDGQDRTLTVEMPGPEAGEDGEAEEMGWRRPASPAPPARAGVQLPHSVAPGVVAAPRAAWPPAPPPAPGAGFVIV